MRFGSLDGFLQPHDRSYFVSGDLDHGGTQAFELVRLQAHRAAAEPNLARLLCAVRERHRSQLHRQVHALRPEQRLVQLADLLVLGAIVVKLQADLVRDRVDVCGEPLELIADLRAHRLELFAGERRGVAIAAVEFQQRPSDRGVVLGRVRHVSAIRRDACEPRHASSNAPLPVFRLVRTPDLAGRFQRFPTVSLLGSSVSAVVPRPEMVPADHAQ